MLEIGLTIFIGILGGVAVGLQSPIAGAMSQRIGGTAGSFIVHFSGAILSALLLFTRGGENIRDWRGLPWYMLGSGAFGLILYLCLSRTLPRLGATSAIVLIIIGQLLIGMVVDQFGLFGVPLRPVSGMRVIAAIMLLTGGYLMVR